MPVSAVTARTRRDPRLDFFRGLAMFFIVIAHAPGNAWVTLLPTRYGFSDAASIFVFCSGIASAVAFGATFVRRGWWLGTARILHRCWQVYWVHVGTFVVIAGAMVWLTLETALPGNYIAQLNLTPFFREPATNLLGFLTLSYVPNYFDILPMYLVLLAMIPAVMALARANIALVAPVLVALWLAANAGWLALPAEPWSQRPWFFNPFGWQLLFFLGFAYGAGWLKPPPVTPLLVGLAVAFLVVSVPLAHGPTRAAVPALAAAGEALAPLTAKTPHGLLRLAHFLAVAYLAWILAGPGGARLLEGARRAAAVAVVRKVGQQSLAVFAAGLLYSRLMGVGLDILGRGLIATAIVNLLGIAAVIATAYGVAWIKSVPWRGQPQRAPAAGPPQAALEPAGGELPARARAVGPVPAPTRRRPA